MFHVHCESEKKQSHHTLARNFAKRQPVFTAQRYASAVLAVVVCLSVCPSVCPSQAGIVSKRLHIGSRKQHYTIAQGL